jgi:hypothetical protein
LSIASHFAAVATHSLQSGGGPSATNSAGPRRTPQSPFVAVGNAA